MVSIGHTLGPLGSFEDDFMSERIYQIVIMLRRRGIISDNEY